MKLYAGLIELKSTDFLPSEFQVWISLRGIVLLTVIVRLQMVCEFVYGRRDYIISYVLLSQRITAINIHGQIRLDHGLHPITPLLRKALVKKLCTSPNANPVQVWLPSKTCLLLMETTQSTFLNKDLHLLATTHLYIILLIFLGTHYFSFNYAYCNSVYKDKTLRQY